MTDANPKTDRTRGEPSCAGNEQCAQTPFFSAVLTPYRSLGPHGFVVLMLVIGTVSFTCGIAFAAVGAWPIFGFFGLDVFLVWFAFRANYREARAYEEVYVTSDMVVLRKVSARGDIKEFRFNPAWVRIDVERVEDEGVTRLALRSHGRAVPVGDFLNPPDREDFTHALGAALASARHGEALSLGNN